MSSIGFLFEFDSTRILFTGGDDVPRLVASRPPLSEHAGGRVHIDTLKVPHHGSDQQHSPESCCSSSTAAIPDIHQGAQFHNGGAENIRSDERFAYGLLLLPMKGPKTEADMALNFVRQTI